MKWIGVLLLLVAPLLFCGAGYMYQEAREAVNSWTSTQARVVRLEDDRDGSAVVFPVFEFTAANGRSYRVKGNHGSSMPEYGVGDFMPILYPEENPNEARENHPLALYMAPAVLAILGLGNVSAGCLIVYLSRRKDLRVARQTQPSA